MVAYARCIVDRKIKIEFEYIDFFPFHVTSYCGISNHSLSFDLLAFLIAPTYKISHTYFLAYARAPTAFDQFFFFNWIISKQSFQVNSEQAFSFFIYHLCSIYLKFAVVFSHNLIVVSSCWLW